MKGEQVLYKNTVESSLPKGKHNKKGPYQKERLDMMASRFYYHTSICRMRYDDCLVQLEKEFCVSHRTIVRLLEERLATINIMVEEKTTTGTLKKRYPWYDWSGKPLIAKLSPQ